MEQTYKTDGGWISTHPPSPKKPPAPPPPPEEKSSSSLSLVGVQSLACGIILLLALLLRLAGGEAFAQVQEAFRHSLQSNDFLGAWVAILKVEEPQANEVTQTVSGRLPPDGALAVNLQVNHPAIPPVKVGTLTSGYGYRISPTGTEEQFHKGIDIAADAGTPIISMFNGEVAEVGENAGLGRYIRLSHGDGVEVLYAHCSELLVEEGVQVRAGETVALVGSTGDSTGNHVHIQISADGTVYNPGGCVALERYA